ncbi:MAG: HemK2/MTQ2 family protein methyltransferase [Candidatus Thermoplasmatota archaeon]
MMDLEDIDFKYQNLKITLANQVYQPAEDTFQLLESIEIEKNDRILEIGTGTGIIALKCATKKTNIIATDINPKAIKIAKKNYKQNKENLKGKIEFIKTNLFKDIDKEKKFDKIIFNPPYVSIKNEKIRIKEKWLNQATDGGPDGLKTLKKFIKKLPLYLKKPDGKAFFITSSSSNLTKVKKYINCSHLKSKILSEKKHESETLYVYQINHIKKIK